MLSKAQQKLIRSLHSKKGRQQSGLCLIEGEKFVKELFSRYDDIMNVALKNKLIT